MRTATELTSDVIEEASLSQTGIEPEWYWENMVLSYFDHPLSQDCAWMILVFKDLSVRIMWTMVKYFEIGTSILCSHGSKLTPNNRCSQHFENDFKNIMTFHELKVKNQPFDIGTSTSHICHTWYPCRCLREAVQTLICPNVLQANVTRKHSKNMGKWIV